MEMRRREIKQAEGRNCWGEVENLEERQAKKTKHFPLKRFRNESLFPLFYFYKGKTKQGNSGAAFSRNVEKSV